MLLHTPIYLLFLAIVVLVYWKIPGIRQRKAWLLFTSYIFYIVFDWRFSLLLALITLVNFWLGNKIAKNRSARMFTGLSIVFNLGALGIFKYLNFFIDTTKNAMQWIGLTNIPPAINLILPVGISFYAFQAISYTVEIYRKKLNPASSLLDLALYIAFFPKLIAGPIIRPGQFFSSLDGPIQINSKAYKSALVLLLVGLVKKVIIADGLAILAETAFRAAEIAPSAGNFPTPLFIQGFYLYAVQIYADFSGYTDIARASSGLLGIKLPENFKQPYFAPSLTIFWNRWHISMTQWFREYLFFPLSRSLLKITRRHIPRVAQITANVVTMALIGLWHGAGWMFMAWGVWHGILLSLESLIRYKPTKPFAKLVGWMITFHLVGLGWILFHSSSLSSAQYFISGLFSLRQMEWVIHYLPSIFLTMGIMAAFDLFESGLIKIPAKVKRLASPVAIIAGLFLLTSFYLLGIAHGDDPRPFIYGQF